MNTLPMQLTPRLLAFCRSISPERPVFVRSKPSRDAVLSECFNNVARKIERAGGTTACGWAIWHLRGVYFEAEHHGVWRKRSGELVDVSPQLNNYPKILFLPDPTAVYDPQQFRGNLIEPDGDDPRAVEVATLLRERYRLLDAERATGAAMVRPQTQIAADVLLRRAGAILSELV